ncbi:MAG: hypothetical protein E7C86_03700 [Paeniclostridium sordellii]|nr:hypothetical protein [Paeniclostridium sordellii]
MIKCNFEIVKSPKNKYLKMNLDNYNVSGIFNSAVLDIDNKNEWLNEINQVIERKKSYGELETQAHSIDIDYDKVMIYYDYSDSDFPELEMKTKDFRKLVEEYFLKLEEFNKHEKLLD